MILGAVQVRMSSTRLPEKALADINGKPMLWHIVDRLKHSKTIDKVVIATTNSKADNPIVEFAEANGTEYYAGSEMDIVDRIFQTAKKFKADAVVKIGGDCPMIDPRMVDRIVRCYLKNSDTDYVSNVHPPTYPDGMDTEIFPFKTLERLWDEVKNILAREWINSSIIKNPEKFRIINVINGKDLSALRWTVDYKEDLMFIREIFKRLSNKDIFYMEDVLELMQKCPDLMEINKKHARNVMYIKTLEENTS